MARRARTAKEEAEKRQQKAEVALVSELFPKVAKIVISMQYRQTGVLEPLSRMVNFFPGSPAVFNVNCLCSDCIEGGYDFGKLLSGMVKTRKTALKGAIDCENCPAPECSDVSYSISIKYSQTK